MSENNNREVNEDDVEILDIANDDAEEATEDGDEEIIPPVEDETETEGETSTEESTESDESDNSSQSDESEDEEESGDKNDDDSSDDSLKNEKSPAPVAGETPRERALRKEVERQKRLRREESVSRLTGNAPVADRTAEDEEASVQALRDLGYSDDEILNMEKAIDVLATKKGYVKSSTLHAQTYQQTVNTVLETFLEAHPEYAPKNDAGDVRWNRFEETLKSGLYNVQGKSAKELNVIFRKVHQDVVDELGDASTTVEKRQENAQRQKIRSVSHSGGTKSGANEKPTPKKKVDIPSIFKGFSDDDF